MSSKLLLAAGSLGVASLAFVGVGGYAAFTSTVSGNLNVTSGTFVLNVSKGTSESSITCTQGGIAQNNAWFGSNQCFEGSAANGVWQWGSGYNAPVENASGSNISITIPNVSPGVAYGSNFSVQDYGSLQGLVQYVNYTANQNNALAQGTKIYVYQAVGQYQKFDNGTVYGLNQNGSYYACSGVNDFSTPSTVVGAQCLQGALNTGLTDRYGNTYSAITFYELLGQTAANGNAQFKVLNGFVQPWRNTQTSALAAPGSEGGVSFKAVVAVSDATGNSAEYQTITPSFSVIGDTLP
ncbi:MAG: hypothetical protein M0000_09500 [Actinomycetota bacterium]|nr:hypothetical protein [Actinomycetota bacterium]MDA8210042.1 hypothetical protein [Actinomycetota bacterium]